MFIDFTITQEIFHWHWELQEKSSLIVPFFLVVLEIHLHMKNYSQEMHWIAPIQKSILLFYANAVKKKNPISSFFSYKTKLGWELRGIARSGYAFLTAQHYSFPACESTKKFHCENAKRNFGNNVNTQCPEYPASSYCGNEVIVLFGGTNGTHFSNKVTFYNPNTGSMGSITALYDGVTPQELRLAGHSSFISGDSLYVVGGLRQVVGLKAPQISNSIYRFNLNTLTWSVVAAAADSIPAVAFHTSSQYGGFSPISIYLFGGMGNNGILNTNMYKVDINPEGNNYTLQILPAPVGPARPATFSHAAQINADNIYYYGGAIINTELAGFVSSNGVPNVLDHSFTPFAELWRYNIATNTWLNLTQIHPYLGETVGPVMLEYNDELYIYGGLGSSFNVSTGVFRISVNNPTYVTRPCCSPGYKGKRCNIPVCSSNCGGPLIGKCVAPETCECFNGFTGKNCEYHLCSETFNQDLIALNDVLFYPKASQNLLNKIDQILQRLIFLKKNLRPWRSNALITKFETIARTMHDFQTQNLDKFFAELESEVASLVNIKYK